MIHPVVNSVLSNLSYGKRDTEVDKGLGDPVGRIARVYETARNALEYRAEHLVRRAAIERMLRRHLLVNGRDINKLTTELVRELVWARYISESDVSDTLNLKLTQTLTWYDQAIHSGRLNKDWVLGVLSAELEEIFNPNTDYHHFTGLAFAYIKQRVRIEPENMADILIYAAVDRVYSQSDDQQLAFHIYKMIRSQSGSDANRHDVALLGQSYEQFKAVVSSDLLNRLTVIVRRQMGPLVLLRDMYFANPMSFMEFLSSEDRFHDEGRVVLRGQLSIMKSRLNTATIRSLIYVFLTKALFGFLIELPVETILHGSPNYVTLAINMTVPVAILWWLTATITLPKRNEQERLISRAWQIVNDFEKVTEEEMVYMSSTRGKAVFGIFSVLWFALMGLVLFLIAYVLKQIGYSLVSIGVFVMFLSLVSFFAYRIRLTSQVYSFRPRGGKTSIGDMLLLPIVAIGRMLSKGVSRLNILIFLFDFVLEAPLKILLRVMDGWFSFLSAKRDEMVG